MGKDSDEFGGKERRIEAAEWWVEFDSGRVLTNAQKEAWLQWSARPSNQQAFDDIVDISILVRALGCVYEFTCEKLQVFEVEGQAAAAEGHGLN